MQVNIKGLIKRLDDLRERLNKLFEKLEKLDDLDYDIAVEDVEQYFQNDDAFNLSIALDVLEQAEKLDNVLEIISQNFRLVGNCLHAKNKYAEDGWVFVKEIEDEEELEAWKEVLK